MKFMRKALVSFALLSLSIAGTACAQGVEKVEVREGGLVANLWRPADAGTYPGVLILGGSGGGIGWQDYMGELLAGRGFAALAVAYFGMEGLPPELERIPLEYIEHALTYLRLQPLVDAERIGVVGVSKGGELALLVASMHSEISVAATFVPSSVVWQSIADGYPETSSWSHRGRDVPFVAYGNVENPSSVADIYRAGVDQAPALEGATIAVEHIGGPVLLLSGSEDSLWPSSEFSEAVIKRLEDNSFPHSFEHVTYPDAGHLISSVRDDDVSYRGGTEDGNRVAQVDARDRLFAFLELHLGSR